MSIKIFPIVEECLQIYQSNDPMNKFDQYVDLMTQKHRRTLPIGDFSPMGRRQKKYLEHLLEMNAETWIQDYLDTLSSKLKLNLECILVVVDEPKNGWTQRHITDAHWRFNHTFSNCFTNTDGWIAAYLWTTDIEGQDTLPSPLYLKQQTTEAISRKIWQSTHGLPMTLEDTLKQEGSALNDAESILPVLSTKRAETLQQVAGPIMASQNFGDVFSFMYGDKAALGCGYQGTGVGTREGFMFAKKQFTETCLK